MIIMFRIKSPVALLRLYLTQLWTHLSVVQKQSTQELLIVKNKPTKINQTYLASFVAFSIIALHGIFGLYYESGHQFQLKNFRSSPFVFWRQFFLWPIWPQMDIAVMIAILSEAYILLDFAVKKPINWKYLFAIDSGDARTVMLNGNYLSYNESTKILKIFRYARFIYKLFGLVIYSITMLYIEVMVFLVTKVYLVSVWTLSFWIFEFPSMHIILMLFIFANLTHIIVSGGCIQTRQQHLCEQFRRLLLKLEEKKLSARGLQLLWFHYIALNRVTLSICSQLQAFNTFYTNYLTMIFFKYIVFMVMFAHIIFYGPSNQPGMLILKGILVVSLLETIVLLFGLIQFCALVVKKNGQIGRLNRLFAVHCLRHQPVYRLSIQQLLKIELLQWPHRLPFYAFKLLGDNRITSKTFYVMSINITGFFLFVMTNIHKNSKL